MEVNGEVLHPFAKIHKIRAAKKIKLHIDRLRARVMSRLTPKPMVVSFPKCGRTWIANVLLNYIIFYGDTSRPPLDFSVRPQFKNVVKSTPFKPIIFSHDVFSLKIPVKEWPRWSAVHYHRKQKALLIRDPRDVLVSLYYHALGRRYKNNLPADISITEFLEKYALGIDALIIFLNIWAPAAVHGRNNVTAFRYEEFLGGWSKCSGNWEEFVRFITERPVHEKALEKAVQDNEINVLKKRLSINKTGNVNLTGPGGRIRKGKAGGYLTELRPDEITMIEQRLLRGLNREARQLLNPYLHFT